MIKINLLPSNIFEARIVKRLIAVFVVLLIAVVGGCLYYMNDLKKQTEEWNAKNDDATRLLNEANGYAKETTDLYAAADSMITKVKFFDDVTAYNKKFPALYENIAKFTYKKVKYSQLSPAGNTVTITAYAPTLSDAGRYLLNMYRATHLFSQVSISGVPGFPQEGGPGGGGVGAVGAPPMPQTGGRTLPPLMGLRSSQAVGPMPTGGLPAGLPGFAPTGGAMNAIESSVARAEERRRGFEFTVTLMLTDTPVAPVPPGLGGATQGMGGPGMPPVMPGMPTAGTNPSPAAPVSPAPSGGGDDDTSTKAGGRRGGGGE